MVCMTYSLLKSRSLSLDELLNFLLTKPHFFIGSDVGQGQVGLVKCDLFAAFTVFDRVDLSCHHIVRTQLLTHRLDGFKTGKLALISLFVA